SEISLVALKFTFQGDEQSDAIPLLYPVAPEYPPRSLTSVAYELNDLPQKVKIYCLFKATDSGFSQSRNTSTVSVRAVLAKSGTDIAVCQKYFGWDSKLFSYSAPDIGFIPFMLDTTILFGDNATVGVYESEWEWQWAMGLGSSPTAEWKTFATTTIEFLLTLNKPYHPWGWRLHANDLRSKTLIPFASLVRHACKWAQGATKEATVCALVAKGFTEQTKFQYSTANAYTIYQIDPSTRCPISLDNTPDFQIRATDLVDRLHGWDGNGNKANCADLAHILMLIANAIGCCLSVGILQNSANPNQVFSVNEIIPLNCELTSSEAFMFHVVAYLGDSFDENALVFDACLQFPNGTDSPISVLGMPQTEYIQRLAKNPADCIPQKYAARERIHLI
ncbi:MAG: hypothetical protein RLZZ519_417, partial [Bacteroidota bacterium]